jgi:hypothetical protein
LIADEAATADTDAAKEQLEEVPEDILGQEQVHRELEPEAVETYVKPKKKGKKGLSPFLAKITRPLVKELSTKPPAFKLPFPVDHIPPPKFIPARSPDVEWTPWLNPKTGKLHEPIPVPLPHRGSSRQRSREYSKLLGDATIEDRAHAQAEHDASWRRARSATHGTEYRRWYHLEEPVPGWSPHSTVISRPPATPWREQKIEIPFKMGSRFTQRVGSVAPEKITAITMLACDLKEERGRANMVIDGQHALKSVRTLVQQSAYDRALQTADKALQQFKAAGKVISFSDSLINSLQ